jgi:hypothetical protein
MDPASSTGTESGRGPIGSLLAAPGAVIGHARRTIRDIEKSLAGHTATRALVAVPRTAKFMGATRERLRRDDVPGLPVPSLSPALAGQVAIDETILAVAMGPNRFPRRSDYERVAAELADARDLFEAEGWLADPASYHRRPPNLESPTIERGWALGQRYERLSFPSQWAPRDGEPGRDRWIAYEANHTAVATVLRHKGAPRPWVVATHGFACGYAFMDFVGLHALHLHRDLGLNVVMPVLPLHGPRKINRFSGEEFLSFDLINTVHGLTQAIWDIRQILSWVRAQGAPDIALYGVSLGGYVTALLTSLENDIDAAVAGIPVVDFPAMFRHQSPLHIRLRAVEHEILDGNAEIVHRVISPLAMPPRLPRERRFIFAGLGDRMAPPTQAHALWHHWQEPEILWYGGNHVGYLWSKQVTSFLDQSLTTAGLVPTTP